jgi:hypothetical protein
MSNNNILDFHKYIYRQRRYLRALHWHTSVGGVEPRNIEDWPIPYREKEDRGGATIESRWGTRARDYMWGEQLMHIGEQSSSTTKRTVLLLLYLSELLISSTARKCCTAGGMVKIQSLMKTNIYTSVLYLWSIDFYSCTKFLNNRIIQMIWRKRRVIQKTRQFISLEWLAWWTPP